MSINLGGAEMSVYDAKVVWERKPQELYTDSKYSRAHQWQFDGGAVVDASASPQIVPLPYSVAANVDPEEAFVASLVVFFRGGSQEKIPSG
ncbi:MAG: hypothetical protein OFPII_32280 [Osedax symbiont Rs1]|nr:MAG: hypothetical protein OFPII_32280 [Osedax symbiont Rs1]